MNEIINEKTIQLEETIQTLKKFEKMPKEEFVSKRTIYYGAVYALIIGVDCICSIGNHILSYYFNRKAETYKEIILLLGEFEIIPEKFAEETQDMTKFRNLAVHLYGKVDPNKVYAYIPLAIEQFKQYVKYFIEFEKKE
jgi:uncharacterized protein YutE (UPF0331/DUF86 family)